MTCSPLLCFEYFFKTKLKNKSYAAYYPNLPKLPMPLDSGRFYAAKSPEDCGWLSIMAYFCVMKNLSDGISYKIYFTFKVGTKAGGSVLEF
jgi:hypothetical protein